MILRYDRLGIEVPSGDPERTHARSSPKATRPTRLKAGRDRGLSNDRSR